MEEHDYQKMEVLVTPTVTYAAQDTEEPDDEEIGFQEKHKNFYGLLMLYNEKISDAGTVLIWVLGTLGFALCVAIHQQWFDSFLGISVEKLRGIGVYLLIALIVFSAFAILVESEENRIYNSIKPEIFAYLEQNRIALGSLLVDIKDDPDVKDIRKKLMQDAGIGK